MQDLKYVPFSKFGSQILKVLFLGKKEFKKCLHLKSLFSSSKIVPAFKIFHRSKKCSFFQNKCQTLFGFQKYSCFRKLFLFSKTVLGSSKPVRNFPKMLHFTKNVQEFLNLFTNIKIGNFQKSIMFVKNCSQVTKLAPILGN